MSPEFALEAGLGQGCCLAPLLFNIYFGAVLETWLASDPQRIHCATRIDGLLRRQADLTKYALHTPWTFQELGYADDLALIAETLDQLRHTHMHFFHHLNRWGLNLSTTKTKALASLVHHTGSLFPDKPPDAAHAQVQFTDSFRYLGSHVDWKLSCVSPRSNIVLTKLERHFGSWPPLCGMYDSSPLLPKSKFIEPVFCQSCFIAVKHGQCGGKCVIGSKSFISCAYVRFVGFLGGINNNIV